MNQRPVELNSELRKFLACSYCKSTDPAHFSKSSLKQTETHARLGKKPPGGISCKECSAGAQEKLHCSRCGAEKPASKFSGNQNRKLELYCMECQVDVSDDLAVGANRRELEDEDEYNLDDDLISYSDIASVSAFSAPSQMSVRDEVRVTQPNRGRRGKKDLKALPNPAEPVDRDTQAMIDQLEQSVDASAAEDGWRTIGPAKPKRLPRGRPT